MKHRRPDEPYIIHITIVVRVPRRIFVFVSADHGAALSLRRSHTFQGPSRARRCRVKPLPFSTVFCPPRTPSQLQPTGPFSPSQVAMVNKVACRLCLQSERELIDVFSDVSRERNVAAKILFVLSVLVSI